MEPSPAESSAFACIADIAAWVPVPPEPLADFCAVLGIDPTAHYRVIGYMAAEWFQHSLDNWTYQGGSPSPALYCQLGLLGRTAR
eukprot:2116459-Amphidinium_carterae.1